MFWQHCKCTIVLYHWNAISQIQDTTPHPLSKRPGSVWNCLWGHALKRSPGIYPKSRVSYPVPRFLSSATWPSLPKKHYLMD